MEPPEVVKYSPRLIRIRRKRSADPVAALLLTGALDDETAAGPSKKSRPNEPNGQADADVLQPEAYRLLGTLPMPDVRDAARLFLSDQNPKIVHLVDVDNLNEPKAAPVIPVQVEDVQELLLKNMAKVDKMDIGEKPVDPYLAVADEAPLARPESGLEGELDDYVYDFYHAGPSASTQLYERVNVRLPTDEELQLYFGPTDSDDDEEAADDDEDSNAENYYANSYPDEDEFENGDALENDTTSDDSYDHYGDEDDREDIYSHVSEADN